MSIKVHPEEMSIAEKIITMEILWDDLSRNAEEYLSPNWHAEILKHREENLKKGKDEFEDWDKVKKELWHSLI